jgi:hypothetical protein
MSNFYVRVKPEFNGTNMVHKKGCPFMPDAGNRIPLGEFSNNKNAVKEAGRFFSRINGCYFCIKECHDFYNNTNADVLYGFYRDGSSDQ